MDPLAIAGLGVKALGSFLGFGSSSKTNETNLQIARETNEANAELAKYNWEQQKEMWNAQNAYNTPSAQMSRYRDAGLNPNLIYGQGSNGNSTSIPTPATPTMQAAHVDRIPYETLVGGLGDDLLKAYNFHLQREKLEADTQLAESQAAAQLASVNKSNAEIAKLGQETARTSQQYRQSEELFDYTKKAADLQVKQGFATLEDTYNRIEQRPLERQKLETEIRLLESGIVKNRSQAALFYQDIEESAARIVKFAAETDNLRVLGGKLGLETDLLGVTFNTQVSQVAAALTDKLLQNNWHRANGFASGGWSGVYQTGKQELENIGSLVKSWFK